MVGGLLNKLGISSYRNQVVGSTVDGSLESLCLAGQDEEPHHHPVPADNASLPMGILS